MSRKSFFILISILFIIILAVGIGLYFNAKKQNDGVAPTLRDFFPFGGGGKIIDLTPTKEENPDYGTNPNQQPTGPEKILRLRKVGDAPVVGYTLVTKEVIEDPADLLPKTKTISPPVIFTKKLKLNSKDSTVIELQKLLNQCPETMVAMTGPGSPGKENDIFGKTTETALKKLQEKLTADILTPQNQTVGNGILDELTRKRLVDSYLCTLPLEKPKTIKKSVVRYVEKGSSNIYDAFADTLENTRLSNTTIPRVQEAFFSDAGKVVYLRYLRTDNQTIETYAGLVVEPTPGTEDLPELQGAPLLSNILDLSISPDGKQILYMIPAGTELLGFISDPLGKNQRRVFGSEFTGWLSQWATKDTLLFTVKATGYGKGYAYTTDVTKGGFTKAIGNMTGLTTLMSPDGRYILFSRNTANGPALGLLNTQNKQVRDLNVLTLPEKCVWGRQSLVVYCAVPNSIPTGEVYPDSWYQGIVSFNDSLWSIDVTGVYDNQLLVTPEAQEGGGQPVDGIRLSVDDTNKYLYFMDKQTGTLWQYALIEPIQETDLKENPPIE